MVYFLCFLGGVFVGVGGVFLFLHFSFKDNEAKLSSVWNWDTLKTKRESERKALK